MSVLTLDPPVEKETVSVPLTVSTSVPDPTPETLPAHQKMTVEEYFDLERCSVIRHEYANGEAIPMSGTTATHNQIAGNIFALLHTAFEERDCVVSMSDIRLRVSPTNYRYPDVMALCETPVFDSSTPPCLLNPAVIVEVLSPSTSKTDLNEKVDEYFSIPSVTDYLVVASDRMRGLHYVRQKLRSWLRTEFLDANEPLEFPAHDVTIPLSRVYRKVVFETAEIKAEPAQ